MVCYLPRGIKDATYAQCEVFFSKRVGYRSADWSNLLFVGGL